MSILQYAHTSQLLASTIRRLSITERRLNPRAPTLEQALVEKLAILLWRYRRFRAEAKDIQTVIENDLLPPHKSVLNNADHLLRYETSIEGNFDRALRIVAACSWCSCLSDDLHRHECVVKYD